MPVKNGAPFIRHAIQSILMQNYGNIEVIVVHGASTERTLEILSEFTKAYSFTKIISETNTGQS
ncbi:MAG: glycosyltransferase family 2 protein [Bdellovibrionales bacterium]|nr:glycosyltransferase family 2 protein [Bdellovibrionales bacterium]